VIFTLAASQKMTLGSKLESRDLKNRLGSKLGSTQLCL
jgi:hypothetical protein